MKISRPWNQPRSFRLLQALAVLMFSLSAACSVGLIYVAWHFVSKFW